MCTNLLISLFSHAHPPSLNVIPRPVLKKEIVKYRHQRGRSPEITYLQRRRGSSGGATCLRSLFSDLFIEHPRGARLWAFMLRTWKAKIPQQLTGSWWKQMCGQTGHCAGYWVREGQIRESCLLHTTCKVALCKHFLFLRRSLSPGISIPISQVRKQAQRKWFRLSLAGGEWAVRRLPCPLFQEAGSKPRLLALRSRVFSFTQLWRNSSLLTVLFYTCSSQLNISHVNHSLFIQSVSVFWAPAVGLAWCQAGVALPFWRSNWKEREKMKGCGKCRLTWEQRRGD